jgi:hypothetical protein
MKRTVRAQGGHHHPLIGHFHEITSSELDR